MTTINFDQIIARLSDDRAEFDFALATIDFTEKTVTVTALIDDSLPLVIIYYADANLFDIYNADDSDDSDPDPIAHDVKNITDFLSAL